MRTKTVTYDDQQYKISPLSMRQTETFNAEKVPDLTKMEPAEVAAYGTKKAVQVICWSLNNASPNSDKPWDEERCMAELDPWVLFELMKEIFAFSGFEPLRASAHA